MEFKLIRDGFRNYLQVEGIEVKEEQYETQMLLKNDLSHFLKLEIRGINQNRSYCYCVNSKQSLRRVLDLKAMEYEELKDILMGILSALKQLKEYFLKEDRAILNLDTIYLELGKKEVSLCYVPGYDENIGLQLKNLMEQLMDVTPHTDQKAVVLVYGLYRITRQENYTLQDLENFMFQVGEERKESKGKNESKEKRNRQYGRNQQILDELFGSVQKEEREENSEKKAAWMEEGENFLYGKKEKKVRTKREKEEFENEEVESERYHRKRGKWWYIALVFDLVVGVCITYLMVLLMSRGLNSKGVAGLGLLTLGFFGMSFFAARKEEDLREEEEEMQKAILQSEQEKEEVWYEEEDSFFEEKQEKEYEVENLRSESENQNKTTVLYEESVPKLISLGRKEEQIILDHFPFIIGSRKDTSDYAIMEKGVSRMHADISFEDGVYYITDLNSTNGTFLNEKEIEPGTTVPLKEGDEIRIAKRRLLVEGIG